MKIGLVRGLRKMGVVKMGRRGDDNRGIGDIIDAARSLYDAYEDNEEAVMGFIETVTGRERKVVDMRDSLVEATLEDDIVVISADVSGNSLDDISYTVKEVEPSVVIELGNKTIEALLPEPPVDDGVSCEMNNGVLTIEVQVDIDMDEGGDE